MALRSVVSVLILLGLMLYVFAIFFAQNLGEEKKPAGDLFRKIPQSMWTLIFMGTFLDEVPGMMDSLKGASYPLTALMLVFIFGRALDRFCLHRFSDSF